MKTVKEVIKEVSERYDLLVFIRDEHGTKMYEVNDDNITVIPPDILRRSVRKKRMNKNKWNIHVELDI